MQAGQLSIKRCGGMNRRPVAQSPTSREVLMVSQGIEQSTAAPPATAPINRSAASSGIKPIHEQALLPVHKQPIASVGTRTRGWPGTLTGTPTARQTDSQTDTH
jgi:hypothetical protein